MKQIALLASLLLTISTVQAKTIKITVDNRSNFPMTIQKFDGLVTIPAKTKIENQAFKLNETVINYIDGKKVCTWTIQSGNKNFDVTGIYYQMVEESGHTPECITIVTPKN